MCPITIRPTAGEFHLTRPMPIDRSVLHLIPPKLATFICYKIERTMFGLRSKDHEPLLEQINLSLQDPEVTLVFGVM